MFSLTSKMLLWTHKHTHKLTCSPSPLLGGSSGARSNANCVKCSGKRLFPAVLFNSSSELALFIVSQSHTLCVLTFVCILSFRPSSPQCLDERTMFYLLCIWVLWLFSQGSFLFLLRLDPPAVWFLMRLSLICDKSKTKKNVFLESLGKSEA